MSEKTSPNLNGIAETLLIPLYVRAVESQRPDAMIKDDKAVAMVKQMDCDFSRLKLQGHDEIALILRVKEFDRHAQDFLSRNPEGVVRSRHALRACG
jgi:O-methyltransferase involved in polyketide biosynthesis